jgi:release factor glutamine methyltransferase
MSVIREARNQKNVLDNEPHLALFVEDNDALVFIKKLPR